MGAVVTKDQLRKARNIAGALKFLATEAQRAELSQVMFSLKHPINECSRTLEAAGEQPVATDGENDFLMVVRFLSDFVSTASDGSREDFIRDVAPSKTSKR
jgi:hypothetical protein